MGEEAHEEEHEGPEGNRRYVARRHQAEEGPEDGPPRGCEGCGAQGAQGEGEEVSGQVEGGARAQGEGGEGCAEGQGSGGAEGKALSASSFKSLLTTTARHRSF